MPKGTPLPPEVAELIGELYAKTGNLSETARQLNLAFETVRDTVAKSSNARRRQLHEQAIDEGLERGREHLSAAVDLLGRQYVEELTSGTLEPNHRRDLMLALAAGSRALVTQKLLSLKVDQSRLTRKRTRLEIDELAAEAQKRGRGGARKIFTPADPGWEDIQREVFGSPRQGFASARSDRTPTERGAADVAAGDLPAVPAPVDPRPGRDRSRSQR
jgi:hypothetical protein